MLNLGYLSSRLRRLMTQFAGLPCFFPPTSSHRLLRTFFGFSIGGRVNGDDYLYLAGVGDGVRVSFRHSCIHAPRRKRISFFCKTAEEEDEISHAGHQICFLYIPI